MLPLQVTAFFNMSKSSALMDETPIMFQPSLAKLVGLHEAIVLQTLRFWCGNKKSGKVIDGERWIYNSAAEWQELSFPFWSTKTIGDLFLTLEKMGLVKSEQFDLKEGKARKYYTLTEAALTVLTIERATHLEDSSTSIWKILPDHVEDSSRSARARHIKQYTENLTENTKPLTPLQGEEESSAVASHSSEVVTQPNLFPTNPSEANASGSANAKLNSADGNGTTPPIPLAPPRNKKSSATEIEKPSGVSEQVWNDFIALRKAKRAPLSATALSVIAQEAEKAAMHIEEALTECVTRGWQSFKAEWIKPKTTTKPERFSNF
jgi:DNA-binding PadR family transcriptional regulator